MAVDGDMENVHALFVGVGWVVVGAPVDPGPPHANNATTISDTANTLAGFMGGDDTRDKVIR